MSDVPLRPPPRHPPKVRRRPIATTTTHHHHHHHRRSRSHERERERSSRAAPPAASRPDAATSAEASVAPAPSWEAELARREGRLLSPSLSSKSRPPQQRGLDGGATAGDGAEKEVAPPDWAVRGGGGGGGGGAAALAPAARPRFVPDDLTRGVVPGYSTDDDDDDDDDDDAYAI